MRDEETPRLIVRRFIRDHIEALLVVIFIAILARVFIISTYKVTNDAMAPASLPGDFFFAYRIPYGLRVPILGTKVGRVRSPERGQLVVFRSPDPLDEGDPQLRRVIAVPGDQVEIRRGVVWINGKALEYTKTDANNADPRQVIEHNGAIQYPILFESGAQAGDVAAKAVPPQTVFVLSDNRSRTDDSRQFGFVPFGNLEGEPFLVWLSFDWDSSSRLPRVRTQRIFTRLH